MQVKCQPSWVALLVGVAAFMAYMYLSLTGGGGSSSPRRLIQTEGREAAGEEGLHHHHQHLMPGLTTSSSHTCIAPAATTTPPPHKEGGGWGGGDGGEVLEDDTVTIKWRYFLNETVAMLGGGDSSNIGCLERHAPCVVDARLMEASVGASALSAVLTDRWARVINHRRRTNDLLRGEEVDVTTIHAGISRREPRDPSLEDDYTWMLPPHRKLFCPSYLREQPFTSAVNFFHFHTRYSPRAVSGDVVLSLKECPTPAALHMLEPTAIHVDEFFVWKIFSASVPESMPTLRSLEPSFVSFCVYECLRSPFCGRIVADRVTRVTKVGDEQLSSDERQVCRLLQHRETGRAMSKDPRSKAKVLPTSLVLHIPVRPEASPSLVQSHLRWHVFRGPVHMIRMDPYGHRCSACVWEYKLAGRHGVDYNEIEGLAFVEVRDMDPFMGKSPLMADGSSSSGGLLLFSLPQLVAKGRFTLFMNSQVTTSLAGHRINISVRFPLSVATGRGGTREIEVRHHFVIKLLWDSREMVLVTDGTPRLSPSGTFQTKVHHSRNLECAPLLRPNECVVSNVAIRFMAPRHQVPIAELYLAGTWRNGEPITLLIKDQPLQRDTNASCFSIVDGHTVLLRPTEVTPYKCLVIRNDCPGAPLSSFTASSSSEKDGAALTVNIEGPRIGDDQLSLKVPLQQLLDCGVEEEGSTRRENTVGKGDGGGGGELEQQLPILLSSSQYRCPQCVLEQLENFFAFAPNSVVVMRVDDGIDDATFAMIRNRSQELHPRVYFHRDYYGGTLKTHPAHNHALNIRYMAEHHPAVQYSHVVFIAANELLVKAGMESFVKKYDMSGLNAHDVAPGFMTDKVNIFDFHGCLYCDDAEGLRTGHSMSAWSLDEFGVRNDFHLAGVMRKYKLTKFPIRQVYLEGSYFRKEIGLAMANILLNDFDATGMTNSTHNYLTGEELPVGERRYNRGPYSYVRWYATCEIIPMIFFHALCDDDLPGSDEPHYLFNAKMLGIASRPGGRAKCGEHSGTMLWRNPNWEVQKDDVRTLRCSPLVGPFSFKRFPIDSNDPLRKEVLDLQRNGSRSRLLRDSAEDCKGLSPHRPR